MALMVSAGRSDWQDRLVDDMMRCMDAEDECKIDGRLAVQRRQLNRSWQDA